MASGDAVTALGLLARFGTAATFLYPSIMSAFARIPATLRAAGRSLQSSRSTSLPFPVGYSPCRQLTTASSQAATAKTTPPKRGLSTLATAIAVGIAGYSLALVFPPSFYKLLYPTPVEEHPSHDSEEGVAYSNAIEQQLQNLDVVKQLREATVDESNGTTPNVTSLEKEQVSRPRKYKEMRPYSKVPPEKKRHSLTQSTLRGPGMFAVPPLLFYTPDNKECVAIMHLGKLIQLNLRKDNVAEPLYHTYRKPDVWS